MRRLIEQSHLDLCCLQKLLLSPVAVKELKQSVFKVGVIFIKELNTIWKAIFETQNKANNTENTKKAYSVW